MTLLSVSGFLSLYPSLPPVRMVIINSAKLHRSTVKSILDTMATYKSIPGDARKECSHIVNPHIRSTDRRKVTTFPVILEPDDVDKTLHPSLRLQGLMLVDHPAALIIKRVDQLTGR